LWFYMFVGAVMLWLWRQRRTRLVLFLFVTCLGGGIVDTIIKVVVDRPRPIVDHPVHEAFGKSFPSGHAMSSVVCYGAVLLVLMPALRTWRARHVALGATILVCLAIGTSRLFLGVHFLSDVAGGFVLGLAWLIGAVAVFEIWRKEEGRRVTSPLDEGVEPEAGRDLREAAHLRS
jgi:undecaprenyl-diphosphatase